VRALRRKWYFGSFAMVEAQLFEAIAARLAMGRRIAGVAGLSVFVAAALVLYLSRDTIKPIELFYFLLLCIAISAFAVRCIVHWGAAAILVRGVSEAFVAADDVRNTGTAIEFETAYYRTGNEALDRELKDYVGSRQMCFMLMQAVVALLVITGLAKCAGAL
jgi:hypothetical protein